MRDQGRAVVEAIRSFLQFFLAYFFGWIWKSRQWIESKLQKLVIQICRQGPMPSHVAFIMDGNRRFAKRNRLSRTVEGHVAGFEGLHSTMEWCYDLGVKAITVYAFSIENFNRSKEEVSTLMSLAVEKFNYMADNSELVEKYDVQIRILGEMEMLPEEVRRAAGRAINMTKGNKGPIVNICFPYTAKAEMITVSNKAIDSIRLGCNASEVLTPSSFENLLYTADSPKVDILVRTSGERRLSEFLNWQVCNNHCQLEFLDILWPDFKFRHFLPILARYQLSRLAEGL